MIELKDVTKRFGDSITAVDGVNLTVQTGETLVLLGSSGCGKSTTLKMVNRLLDPDEGSIWLEDSDISTADPIELRRSIGYVFQDIGLFPHWTVKQNVGAVLRLTKRTDSEVSEKIDHMMNLVGLDPPAFGDRYPEELSGGQQQRVGVARALAADPKYLLMDEPFGALDGITRESIQDELLRIKSELGKTIIFVTHDLFEAMKLADRIAVMNAGRLEQVGAPSELIQQPATEFVRQLFAKPAAQLRAFQKHKE